MKLLPVVLASLAVCASVATASRVTGSDLRELPEQVTDALGRRAAATTFQPPLQDPFYRVPANISKYRPGQIIRHRSIPTTSFGPDADKAWQLFYRTTGQGKPDGTITTVVTPKRPASGCPKLVAVGMPEDSASLNCATSYAYTAPTRSNNTLEIFGQVAPFAALHQGWYITVPDLEGSKSAFLVGRVEGPAILDGIRATLQFPAAIAKPHKAKVALQGYSGGAHGSGWAAQLASTYAPELNIVGWVAGGLPADILTCTEYLYGTADAGLNFLGNKGTGNARPDYRRFFAKYAKKNLTELYERLGTGEICVTGIAPFAGLQFDDSFTIPDINSNPVPQRVADEEFLGKHQPPLTKIPAWLVHSKQDDVVPYPQARKYATGQCKQGAAIEFVTLPSGSHTTANVLASPSYILALRDFFEGRRTVGKGCRNDTMLPAAFSTTNSRSKDILGDYAYSLLVKQVSAASAPSNASTTASTASSASSASSSPSS
ncbi:unnamed protein product [Parajaminaea phylloscopi]